jgi:hypothetical protein
MSDAPYLYAGERVTCENGHRICVVGKDILMGQLPSEDDFLDWEMPEPNVGAPLPGCARCGAPWYRNYPGTGIHVHTHRGWL